MAANHRIAADALNVASPTSLATGATGVGNADPWNDRVAAATSDLNRNGELTGGHWVDQAGFLETPLVSTEYARHRPADDGVVD